MVAKYFFFKPNIPNFGGLATEGVGIFCGHFVNFQSIWFILWPLGIFCGHLEYFPRFWYVVPRNIWQT
jgi:hypothetical protein